MKPPGHRWRCVSACKRFSTLAKVQGCVSAPSVALCIGAALQQGVAAGVVVPRMVSFEPLHATLHTVCRGALIAPSAFAPCSALCKLRHHNPRNSVPMVTLCGSPSSPD